MKSDKNKQFYIDKLSQYIDKYGMELDTDTISMMIDMELSDTIFEQHMDSCQKLNLVIIFMQWICVVVNCILLFFRVHIGIAVSIITTLLLIVVLVNNHIHNKTWKQAKERNKCIQELIDETQRLSVSKGVAIQAKVSATLGQLTVGLPGPQHPWFEFWGIAATEAFTNLYFALPNMITITNDVFETTKDIDYYFDIQSNETLYYLTKVMSPESMKKKRLSKQINE